jgi:hypothetical protein
MIAGERESDRPNWPHASWQEVYAAMGCSVDMEDDVQDERSDLNGFLI